MKLQPWNPVRLAPNATAFSCSHCGAIAGTDRELTVQGFMRKLRAFERLHNSCAPAARQRSVADLATAVIAKAKG